MNSAKNSTSAPARRYFTLIFVVVLGAISVFVFFQFREMTRNSVEQRHEASRAHLLALHKGLQSYAAANTGSFPNLLGQLFPKYVADRENFFHPAWPDRPGYVYVTGLRAADDPQSIEIFENVPPEKDKLQRSFVTLSGEVYALNKTQFDERLSKQESTWRAEKRLWLAQPAEVDLPRNE